MIDGDVGYFQTLKIDLCPLKTKICMAINILGTLSEPIGDAGNKDERKAAEGFKSSRNHHSCIVTSYRVDSPVLEPSGALEANAAAEWVLT
jgi:hypothetical protein